MLTYEYGQYVTIVEFMRPTDVIQFFCGLHFAAQTWSLVKIPLLHDECIPQLTCCTTQTSLPCVVVAPFSTPSSTMLMSFVWGAKRVRFK